MNWEILGPWILVIGLPTLLWFSFEARERWPGLGNLGGLVVVGLIFYAASQEGTSTDQPMITILGAMVLLGILNDILSTKGHYNRGLILLVVFTLSILVAVK